ncbi:MAG TPA: TIGR00730 family Rossman fold protein [Candidatus Wujingus californicus]|uniref:TIGR00730 family Rossman fold protein n=1 Tax=Candidatus Wujingus californicus TaxID=3367618 RepID=UPI001DEC54FA|nr:TIGR00730 family Rossman fold protein [Planctomycetota bacterium]MDO8131108.1 TIGR00730 family Rossman fold protein [Candidatus Brocadiales bacterium]
MKNICVFCGSSLGANAVYTEAAKQLGKTIVSNGMGLVYGGGSIGLMGVIADAVLKEKGEVIGVIPHALSSKEFAHPGLTELRMVSSMHERKAMMAELSDAFIAMPGGFGTFDEFFEILTWAQLGLHSKPIGLLNVEGYFNLLFKFINHVLKERFIKAHDYNLIITSNDPDKLLYALKEYKLTEKPLSVINWKEA